MPESLVDPRVSRKKFEREVALFRGLEEDYIRRGWWILQAEFPEVHVVFASPKTNPPVVVFGAMLDFTNYDLWPPSVRIVNPFTRVPYKASELPTPMLRRVAPANPAPDLATPAGGGMATGETRATTPDSAPPAGVQLQSLMQSFNPDDPADVPFICLPGVREYHNNPAHTGDSWLLHRRGAEGTLYFILDQLDQYGVQPVRLGLHITNIVGKPVLQILQQEVAT